MDTDLYTQTLVLVVAGGMLPILGFIALVLLSDWFGH